MEVESCVPPGFRFHPTEEELVGYYLTRKVASMKIDVEVISDVDLYKIEPWDLQDRCKHGHEDQSEWYFFSHKDKKYPTGTRTNRATTAGFWKATGRDKAVISKCKIIGMRKTLVFYEGRAPNGRKSDWIMHEYRLQSTEYGLPQEEGWVVCKAFRKPSPNHRQQPFNPWSNNQLLAYHIREEQMRMMQTFPVDIKQKTHLIDSNFKGDYHGQIPSFNHEQQEVVEVLEHKRADLNHYPLFELPHLDSPGGLPEMDCSDHCAVIPAVSSSNCEGQPIDWKALDRLLGSQFLNEPNSSTNYNLGPITLDYETDEGHNHGADLFTSFSN